jgi:hypothetical protein
MKIYFVDSYEPEPLLLQQDTTLGLEDVKMSYVKMVARQE